MPTQFGQLVKEDYEADCAICGTPTRFSHVNPSNVHVPCCKNCHYSLKNHIEEERSRNEDEDDVSRFGCYVVIAVVVIILLAFARSSC